MNTIITVLSLLFALKAANCFEFFESFSDLKPNELNSKMEAFNERWIEQPLDHFDKNENRTFKMRYLENLYYWKPNEPLYFLLLTKISHCEMSLSGEIIKLASDTNGAVFVIEQRYFGKSKPFDNIESNNLKWLTTEQTMNDLKKILINVKSQAKFSHSKVVLVGVTNKANEATWMRMMYPELVDAAWASSAPLLGKKDAQDVLVKCSDNFKIHGSTDCYNKVKSRIKLIEKLLESPDGIAQLKKRYIICEDSDLTQRENKMIFMKHLIWSYIYQMDSICDKTSNVTVSLPGNENGFCIEIDYKKWINEIKNNSKMYYYQDCTERGRFATTSSKSQIFGKYLPLEFYLKFCSDVYGSEFNEALLDKRIEMMNKLFGGKNPDVKKVVFVNGELDGYNILGVTKNLSTEAPAIVIPGQYSFSDLRLERQQDPEELINARKQVKAIIKSWISDSYY